MLIWKYTINHINPMIRIPRGSTILSVGVQNEEIQVWVVAGPSEDLETFHFLIAATGHPTEEKLKDLTFIGTVFQGSLVWHIFLRK